MDKTTLITLALVAATTSVPALATAHDPDEMLDATCAPGANALWVLSPSNMAEVCGQFYGRPGYQAVKPCQPPGPQLVGFPRVVMQVVYDHAHTLPGCDPTLRELLV